MKPTPDELAQEEETLLKLLHEFKAYYLKTMIDAYKKRNKNPALWDEENKGLASKIKAEFTRLTLIHIPKEYLATMFCEQILPEFVSKGKAELTLRCIEIDLESKLAEN